MASLFVNELTVIDFSFLDSNRGIVGESWIVDVILDGQLNDEGMVFDFGLVKKRIKQAIDEGVDHKLLVPAKLAGLEIIQDNDNFEFKFNNDLGFDVHYLSPREAVYLVDSDQVEIVQMTKIIERHLLSLVPDNVTQVQIKLYPQTIDGAYYHYSHGLKKHQGDCQRICHGHRSPIQIYRNENRDIAIEAAIASMWKDIYLITEEDIIAREKDQITLAYEADQGLFQLTISSLHCYLFDTDTTVELIAEHLLTILTAQYPGDKIEIHAFEGFKKGAIAKN